MRTPVCRLAVRSILLAGLSAHLFMMANLGSSRLPGLQEREGFRRFNYFQNADVGAFGGAATYSNYLNEDRTKSLVGGVDISQGSITHSFRASYLKFVNNITDSVVGSGEPFADLPVSLQLPGGFATGPSDNAPQETIQSDRQFKYDGSKVWGNHIVRWAWITTGSPVGLLPASSASPRWR